MRQRSYILSSSILVVAIAPFLVVAEASAQEKDRVYIIPDTQYYTRFEADVDHGNKQIKDKDWDELDQGNDTYRKQMVYIAGDEERTAIAIHMGDITHYNHPREWAVAQNAHSLLHGKVKYTLNSGNHDYPYVGFESSETQSRDDSQYLDHFSAPYQQFYAAEMDAGDWWGYQEEDADGNDSTFTSAPVNSYGTFEILGEPWVVVNLEFAPRKEALCWANDVIENQFSDYNVIIATHCYLGNGDKDVLLASDGERHNCTSAKSVIGANGEDTWRELVSLHNNIRMVHSGHVGGSEHVAEEGEHENEVWQFLTDYQFETIEGFRSGFNSGKAESYGNGWLRYMTFSPLADGRKRVEFDTITVMSAENDFDGEKFNQTLNYSPLVETTYTQDGFHKFYIELDAKAPSYLGPDDLPRFKRIRDFTMNTDSTGQQRSPQIGAAAAPNTAGDATFRTIWSDSETLGYSGIRARPVQSDGCHTEGADRPQAQVGDIVPVGNFDPQIAMNDGGDYVVAWVALSLGLGTGIHIQGFFADGSERFPEQVVNEITAGSQVMPSVAINNAGEFVVVWVDDSDNNGLTQIYGARYNADGSKLNTAADFTTVPPFSSDRPGDFTVNHLAAGNQTEPVVAIHPEGNDFVVAWSDNSNENVSV
jgi:hypothetical protein